MFRIFLRAFETESPSDFFLSLPCLEIKQTVFFSYILGCGSIIALLSCPNTYILLLLFSASYAERDPLLFLFFFLSFASVVIIFCDRRGIASYESFRGSLSV